jgi:hypothetical protein
MRAHGGQNRSDPAQALAARRDLDDVLRRALHAAVEPIEPAGDGLNRILHRLTTPSAIRQAMLLVTECADLARLITIWLEPAFTGAMRLTGRGHAGHRRGWPGPAPRAPLRPRPAGLWLRSALVVASAVAIVVTGVVVLGQMHQIITRTGLDTTPGASAPAHAGAHSAGGGGGPSPTANLTPTGPTRPGTASAQARRASHQPGTTPAKTNHGHHQPHPGKTKPPKGGS